MFHDHNFAPGQQPAHTARKPPRANEHHETQWRFQGTMALFLVGLAVLGFLVAIDRPEWFHIRPATGTSVALSHVTGTHGTGPGGTGQAITGHTRNNDLGH